LASCPQQPQQHVPPEQLHSVQVQFVQVQFAQLHELEFPEVAEAIIARRLLLNFIFLILLSVGPAIVAGKRASVLTREQEGFAGNPHENGWPEA
jgi:hypothetical protein